MLSQQRIAIVVVYGIISARTTTYPAPAAKACRSCSLLVDHGNLAGDNAQQILPRSDETGRALLLKPPAQGVQVDAAAYECAQHSRRLAILRIQRHCDV